MESTLQRYDLNALLYQKTLGYYKSIAWKIELGGCYDRVGWEAEAEAVYENAPLT